MGSQRVGYNLVTEHAHALNSYSSGWAWIYCVTHRREDGVVFKIPSHPAMQTESIRHGIHPGLLHLARGWVTQYPQL